MVENLDRYVTASKGRGVQKYRGSRRSRPEVDRLIAHLRNQAERGGGSTISIYSLWIEVLFCGRLYRNTFYLRSACGAPRVSVDRLPRRVV